MQVPLLTTFYTSDGTEATLPPSVVTITQAMVNPYRENLTKVFLSNIKVIGVSSFHDCESLVSVTIPASVNVIGEGAFNRCTSLRYIHYLGTIEQWNAINKEYEPFYLVPTSSVFCSDGVVNI